MTDTSKPTTATPIDPDAYHPEAVEAKWQARWAERRTNEPDLERAERPFYNLMMFPYPSAEGLHVGNMFAFTGSDVYGRFKRLMGFDVFEPIGFDAFGIHSENHAIKLGINPAILIPQNIENFRRQLRRIGGMFDWRHELSTTDPRYYKWTQWIFLQLFQAGKAYKKAAAVNWCPKDKTVLANEQVIDGRCERCGSVVEQRILEQWFFRITEYADRLLADLDDKTKMDWSDTTTTAQRNWLGRSEGAEIEFPMDGAVAQADGDENEPRIRVYTTRPDTLFGATFMVLAPEHPLVDALTTPKQRKEVEAYRKAAASKDLVSRKVGDREKTGVFTGGYALNPATNDRIPVWIADYVLMEYGTGAIMAVPGHDERDFEFAQKFGLKIVRVVAEPGQDPKAPLESAYVDNESGLLVNSGQFDGKPVPEAKTAIIRWLESIGAGKGVVQYRLHDWCISRQRYWGPPIPMIYCDQHGAVPVPEKDLPVELPLIEDFAPDDSGISPLARHEEWYYVPCPTCGKRSRRETDVSDTFLDSSWYHLRYPSTDFDDRPFDPALTKKWLPVHTYIGGNEHAVLHLLYARFITMVLHDLGQLPFDEPYRKFRAHGLIVKDGAKMSKSRGNVVVPDEYIARWGADTFRMYLMFLGPFQEGGDFRDEGISGPRRFLDKVWGLVTDACRASSDDEMRHEVLVKYHQTVKRVTEGMEELRYNTSIAALMELVNALRTENCAHRVMVEGLAVMLAPFAPHFAEESWERLGHATSVFDARWPAWDPGLVVEDQVEVVVQIGGKTRSKVSVPRDADQGAVVAAAQRDAAVRRFTEGKEVRKVVYVPNRLLNLVVGEPAGGYEGDPSADWLEKVNSLLSAEAIPHKQRPWLAWRRLAMETHRPLALSDAPVKRLFAWFKENTKADAHEIGPQYLGAFYYDAEIWPLIVPVVYGTVELLLLDSLPSMPESVKSRLQEDEAGLVGLASAFTDCVDVGFLAQKCASGTTLSPFGRQLLASGGDALSAASELLVSKTPHAKALGHARTAAENFLKTFLVARDSLDEGGAKREYRHDLPKLMTRTLVVAGDSYLASDFAEVAPHLGVLPDVSERYESKKWPTRVLWGGYSVAQRIAATVLRLLTGEDSRQSLR